MDTWLIGMLIIKALNVCFSVFVIAIGIRLIKFKNGKYVNSCLMSNKEKAVAVCILSLLAISGIITGYLMVIGRYGTLQIPELLFETVKQALIALAQSHVISTTVIMIILFVLDRKAFAKKDENNGSGEDENATSTTKLFRKTIFIAMIIATLLSLVLAMLWKFEIIEFSLFFVCISVVLIMLFAFWMYNIIVNQRKNR